MSGFQKVADNWDSLSDDEKKKLFDSVVDSATVKDLATLGKFKVLLYTDDATKANVTVSAVPKDQLVVSKKLIDLTAYTSINSITITNNVSGNGSVKVAVFIEKDKYMVWDATVLAWKQVTDVHANGMTPADVAAITKAQWDLLLADSSTDTGLTAGMGFAFGFSQTAISDKAEISGITFNADMLAPWEPQQYKTDYTYEYQSQSVLSVTLLNTGEYKVNYPS